MQKILSKGPATIKEGVAKDEAEDFKKQLEEAGATVELANILFVKNSLIFIARLLLAGYFFILYELFLY